LAWLASPIETENPPLERERKMDQDVGKVTDIVEKHEKENNNNKKPALWVKFAWPDFPTKKRRK
jgi:hypothetical protein